VLRALLPEESRALAEALMDGESRQDAAKRLGITRQAVEKRIAKIKEALRPAFGAAAQSEKEQGGGLVK